MMKKKTLFILLLFALPAANAQTVLSLQDALDLAMQNSPQIKQAKLSLQRSEQSLKAQQAALKSNLSLTINPFSYSHDQRFDRFNNTWFTSENKVSSADFRIAQPIVWTDGSFSLINRLQWQEAWSDVTNARNTTWSNNLYFSYNQPLFTYNRTKLALNELELDFENTSLSYVLRRLALEYDVTNGFYEVYRSKLNYNIAQEEYSNTNNSYLIIKNKVDAGLAAKEELYQAELNLLNSESKVQNNNVLLENALDSFKKLIGFPVLDSLNIMGDVTHQVVPIDAKKAIDEALKNRLELRQRNIDIQSAYNSLIETMAYNEFKGNVNLTYGIIGVNDKFAAMYDRPTKDRQATISFNVPLFDWGERKARVKASEAILESRRVSLTEEKDDIIISIRKSNRQILNLVKQIEIARQNVKNADLTYEINLQRYENGDLTSMDLNLFQIQLSDAKIQLTDSIINYKLALLNLKIQSMYDFVRHKPVVAEELLKN